MVCTGS